METYDYIEKFVVRYDGTTYLPAHDTYDAAVQRGKEMNLSHFNIGKEFVRVDQQQRSTFGQ